MDNQQKTNTWAILALIFAFLLPPVGVVFSIVALVEIGKDNKHKGRGLAIAGLIIGIILTILPILLFMLGLFGAFLFFAALDPSALVPPACSIGAGFECADWSVQQGSVSFTINNYLGTEISAGKVMLENKDCTPSITSWASGQSMTFTCNADTGMKDDIFVSEINLIYSLIDSPFEKTSTGRIVGKVS